MELVKLLKSGKFIFAMIIYMPTTVALFLNLLDGTVYAAIVATIITLFLATYSISDVMLSKRN